MLAGGKLFRYNGVTGHRGNPAVAPENTLESFASAIGAGVDFLETDIHLTKDDVAVLCHDATTGRTCGEDRIIAESTYAELALLNASTNFNAVHPATPYAPTRIPKLEELFALLRSFPDVRLSLQPKCDRIGAIVDAVKRGSFESRIAFNDGNAPWLIELKKCLPGAVIFYDTTGTKQLDQGIELALRCHFHGIVAHCASLDSARVESIIAAGLEPGVWTISSEEEIRRFLAMKVYRFYSDDPGLVRRLKGEFR